MNRSPDSPTENRRRKPAHFNLATARRMLPLVQRIVTDWVTARRELQRMTPELEGLIRDKRSLSWPERQRRYHLEAETERARRTHREAAEELRQLGVQLCDLDTGEVGFPTVVNGREAFFSWLANEDGVHYWRYADETSRRPLPQDSLPGSPLRQTQSN